MHFAVAAKGCGRDWHGDFERRVEQARRSGGFRRVLFCTSGKCGTGDGARENGQQGPTVEASVKPLTHVRGSDETEP
jgi:hypothetical protein